MAFYHMYLRAAPFNPVRTALFPGDAAIAHIEGRGVGTGWIAVFIENNLFERTFIPWIVRDECFSETKNVYKGTVDIRNQKRRRLGRYQGGNADERQRNRRGGA